MNNIIQVSIKDIYGRKMVYVVDQEQKKLLNQLTNTETLTNRHIEALKGLGFKVITKSETVEL